MNRYHGASQRICSVMRSRTVTDSAILSSWSILASAEHREDLAGVGSAEHRHRARYRSHPPGAVSAAARCARCPAGWISAVTPPASTSRSMGPYTGPHGPRMRDGAGADRRFGIGLRDCGLTPPNLSTDSAHGSGSRRTSSINSIGTPPDEHREQHQQARRRRRLWIRLRCARVARRPNPAATRAPVTRPPRWPCQLIAPAPSSGAGEGDDQVRARSGRAPSGHRA